MADFEIPDKTQLTSVDRAADSLLIYDNSASSLKRATVNNLTDLTSHPVGIDDVQTLTNKTITAPTISSPVLSGTVTGTYTLGGTPTFPSSVVTLTDSQTLTNKTLTSPAINTATIANPTLTVDSISEYTSAAGVTIDGVLLKDSKMNGSYITNATINTAQLANSAVDYTKVAAGMPVQVVDVTSSATASGTTVIPMDDTIPQITEGTEFMTLAITPKSATNKLVIEAYLFVSHSIATQMVGALFQDSTASALAASVEYQNTPGGSNTIIIRHTMTSGTTSSTTFRVRAGGSGAGTMYFNGVSTGRVFGAITKSSIVITEYKV